MNATGLGKLVPNMILMGFKNNWMEDLDSINEYLNVVHHGFDMHMAVGIMRLKDGCDYSAVISKIEKLPWRAFYTMGQKIKKSPGQKKLVKSN